jgi:hypothetical protein
MRHSSGRGVVLAVLALWAVEPLQGQSWAETATVIPSDGELGDSFAYAVAVSGDTVVVGAFGDLHAGVNSGSAYVYERDHGGSGAWGEATKLLPSDAAAGDSFGQSVAIDGDRILVGAVNAAGYDPDSGAAYVFERDAGGPGAWGQVAKLTSTNTIDSVTFGYSVALSGDTAVVGDVDAFTYPSGWPEETGAAFVFERDQGGPGAWGQVVQIAASDAAKNAYFGCSISLSADTVAVGAELATVGGFAQAGSAYVFERDQGGPNAWGEVAAFGASDGAVGEQFGHALGLDGDALVIGANRDDAAGFQSGSAYVFERDHGGAGNWGELKKLVAADGSGFAYFGESVSLSAGRALIGAWGDASLSGAAYLFERDAGGPAAWGETQKLTVAGSFISFGYSASISGVTAVAGAIGVSPAGAGHVFEAFASTNYCTAGTSASGCQATLSASGVASASAASGFVLQAGNVEGAKNGLYYYGVNGRQAGVWGTSSSLQCVTPPVMRAGLLTASGTPGLCDGSFAQDLTALWTANAAKNPGAGATVQAQLWYRDPMHPVNSKNTSLSDGLEFPVMP